MSTCNEVVQECKSTVQELPNMRVRSCVFRVRVGVVLLEQECFYTTNAMI